MPPRMRVLPWSANCRGCHGQAASSAGSCRPKALTETAMAEKASRLDLGLLVLVLGLGLWLGLGFAMAWACLCAWQMLWFPACLEICFSLFTCNKKKQQQQQQTNKENFSADASLLGSISKSDSDSHSHGGALGTWLPATDSCLQQLTNVDCLNWPRGGAFNPELPRKNHGIKIIAAASTLRSALCSLLYSTLCKVPKKFVFPYLHTL